MPSIRDATPDDARRIAETNADCWRRAYRGLVEDARLDGISTSAWAREIEAILARLEPGSFSLVAELDGVFAGSCLVSGPARDGDLGPEVAELVAIYVQPDLWGEGVGTALLEDAGARCARNCFSEISLWTLVGNERARAFYESRGWRLDGAEQLNPRAGAPTVRMRRPLP